MTIISKVILIIALFVIFSVAPVAAAAAAGIDYLGEVCIALGIPGGSTSGYIINPMKLSITSFGTDYFAATGLVKWYDPLYSNPVSGSATVSNGSIRISVSTSEFTMPSATFSIWLDVNSGQGTLSAATLSRVNPTVPPQEFWSSVVDGVAAIMPCSDY